MFNDEYKLIQRMAPLLQKVLIVDPAPASARLLGDLLRNIVSPQIWNAPSNRKGMDAAKQVNPQIIFVELAGDNVDGIAFTKQLRMSDAACRQAPVVMVTATATANAIISARDSGVHEFLRKPYTAKDLLRRLEAVTLRQRDWIEAVHYVGPDRRRFNSGDYTGPLKRRSDTKSAPDEARITQALKILRAAVGAVDTQPTQALRSMLAQTTELSRLAITTNNRKLGEVTVEFQRFLAISVERGEMIPADIAVRARPLIALLPKEEDRDAAA